MLSIRIEYVKKKKKKKDNLLTKLYSVINRKINSLGKLFTHSIP